jgi:hypothetical protein
MNIEEVKSFLLIIKVKCIKPLIEKDDPEDLNLNNDDIALINESLDKLENFLELIKKLFY